MRRIHLFTDFSYDGPYVGEMKSVSTRYIEDITCIDLMHDAPKFNPKASAYLLAALSQQFTKNDSCLAIVDPEVGSKQRRPVLIVADDIVYCGPDNGIFSVVIQKAKKVVCYEIAYKPESSSKTFHGRDLFAPALARYLKNDIKGFNEIDRTSLVGNNWVGNLDEIIYFDGYGNAITGRRGDTITKDKTIVLNDFEIKSAETFSAVGENEPFWYINSMGLVEIAINHGHTKTGLNLKIGQLITIIC